MVGDKKNSFHKLRVVLSTAMCYLESLVQKPLWLHSDGLGTRLYVEIYTVSSIFV